MTSRRCTTSLRSIALRCKCDSSVLQCVRVLCCLAAATLAHFELGDLIMPGDITASGKALLDAVFAASAVKTFSVRRRSRSPGRMIGKPKRRIEFEVPQSMANVRVPIGGPRAALGSLEIDGMSTAQRLSWMEQARVNAILGSCRLSLQSAQSGFRAFRAFAGACTSCVLLLWVVVVVSRCCGVV